ncbi:hypothetical protein Tco_0589342 [Tanacetum coccineum]
MNQQTMKTSFWGQPSSQRLNHNQVCAVMMWLEEEDLIVYVKIKALLDEGKYWPRAEQNIYDPTNADSDDDEWQGSDTDEEEEELCQNEIEMYSLSIKDSIFDTKVYDFQEESCTIRLHFKLNIDWDLLKSISVNHGPPMILSLNN